MKEKIIEMLKIQEALDKSFMEYNNLEELDIDKVQMALFDECGEVNHEMKAEWCYWKKSQKPVDREKLMEELADVWHFALTLHRLYHGITHNYLTYEFERDRYKWIHWFDVLKLLSKGTVLCLDHTIILTEKLGFTFDEIYEAYITKNKENYERMKRGY